MPAKSTSRSQRHAHHRRRFPHVVKELDYVNGQLIETTDDYLAISTRTNRKPVFCAQWCKRNRNHYYIPEWLLKEWRIFVDADLGSAA